MKSSVVHAMIAKIVTAAFFSVPMFFVASLIPEHRVEADTIQWTLNNGSFADGGAVSGSFVWDTTSETATSFNFAVSGGNTGTFPPITYSNLTSGFLLVQNPDDVVVFCLVHVEIVSCAFRSAMEHSTPRPRHYL